MVHGDTTPRRRTMDHRNTTVRRDDMVRATTTTIRPTMELLACARRGMRLTMASLVFGRNVTAAGP